MRKAVLFLFILSVGQVGAQNAIRATLLHAETVLNSLNWNMVIAYDHDVTERTAIGIDITISPDFMNYLVKANYDDFVYYDGGYKLKRDTYGCTLRSQYFFSDNDYVAWTLYIGSFLGLRSTAFELEKAIPSYNPYYGTTTYRSEKYSFNAMTFPIGLRFGARTPLEGFCSDAYIGFGYNIGATNPLQLESLEKKDQLSKFFFQLGFTLGGGW